MRLIFWLLALLAAAVGIILAAKYNIGHVLLVKPPYQIAVSLNIFLLTLLVIFCIFYIFVWASLTLFWLNKHQRKRKMNRAMIIGLKTLSGENYLKTEQTIPAAPLELTNSPVINKVLNSIVSGAIKLRNQYTALVGKELSEEALQQYVNQIKLLLSDGRHKEALDILHTLYTEGGLQPTAILQLELEAQLQAKNWDAILGVTKILEKRQPCDRKAIAKLRQTAHLKNIHAKASDLQLLNSYWKNLPAVERINNQLAIAAAQAYIALGECMTAHKIIEQSLDAKWNDRLVTLYASCPGHQVNKQIKLAEVWLKTHPNNANLLLTLGRLCMQYKLWGKAQNYLEASLSVEPGHTAHLALAQLSEKLGKPELAMDHYKKSLEFTLKSFNLNR